MAHHHHVAARSAALQNKGLEKTLRPQGGRPSPRWSTSSNDTLAFDVQKSMTARLSRKVQDGDHRDATLADVQSLFEILDTDRDGYVTFPELHAWLAKVVYGVPIDDEFLEELENSINECGNGKVNASYFHNLLCYGPLQKLFMNLQLQMQAVKSKSDVLKVDRKFVLQRCQWRTERDDAFRALPFSILYLCVFLGLVITHLRLWERQMLERGMEGHVAEWGYSYDGPYLREHVPNVDNIWIWMETSAMQFAFDFCNRDKDKLVPKFFCEKAPRNMLVSDILLQQNLRNGDEKKVWLLNTGKAMAEQAVGTITTNTMTTTSNTLHHYEGALTDVLEHLKHLRKSRWLNQDTQDVSLQFSTYNEESRLFCVVEVRIIIDDFGKLQIEDYSWALPAETYPQTWVFALDGLYALLLFFPLQAELKEVCRAIKARGTSGFIEYWGFWNAVDWFQIFTGFALLALWILFCSKVGADSIQSLLGSEYELKESIVSLDTHMLHTILGDLKDVIRVYRLLHGFMAANTIAILSKFAKSFKCNSWLDIVSATVGKASEDVFHFMVIFAVVYLGYSLCGHIFLGNDMMAFNSFGASVNTAFYCLLGDFGWYSDLSEIEIPLGSGTPYTLVAIWFWSFMIFTVLLMLNMLLTIVVETYVSCRDDVRMQPDAPSIFEQTRRYFIRRKRYRDGGWIPLIDIYERLIAADPAHPDEIVTSKSLMNAFPTMKSDQAEFLMSWWGKDQAATSAIQSDSYLVKKFKKLNRIMMTIGEQVHVLHYGVVRVEDRIDMVAKGRGLKPGANLAPTTAAQNVAQVSQISRIDIDKTLETQLRVMKELCEQFGRQQECTQRLAEALTELTRVGNMPTS